MATVKSGERKLQILQALAVMLEQPKSVKITTAALAGRLAVSFKPVVLSFMGDLQNLVRQNLRGKTRSAAARLYAGEFAGVFAGQQRRVCVAAGHPRRVVCAEFVVA